MLSTLDSKPTWQNRRPNSSPKELNSLWSSRSTSESAWKSSVKYLTVSFESGMSYCRFKTPVLEQSERTSNSNPCSIIKEWQIKQNILLLRLNSTALISNSSMSSLVKQLSPQFMSSLGRKRWRTLFDSFLPSYPENSSSNSTLTILS